MHDATNKAGAGAPLDARDGRSNAHNANNAHDVIVIGAGVSGLACALQLRSLGARVRVLEAGEQAGGVLGTIAQDGYLFETGPNTIQGSAENFRQLCGQLGIADRLQISGSGSGLRYLFHRGGLIALPTGPLSFLLSPLLSPRGKLGVMTEALRTFHAPSADEPEPTMACFVAERLGHEAMRTLAGGFVRGVYAAEIDQLGAASAFPRMWSAAVEHGGLVRGLLKRARARKQQPVPAIAGPDCKRSDLLSFPRGLGEFSQAAAAALGADLQLRCKVTSMEQSATGWILSTTGGDPQTARQVVLALPAKASAQLIGSAAPSSATCAFLEGIEHAAVTVVHLGLTGYELPPGFGFLVPPDEEARPSPSPRALGVLFPSNLFPGRAPQGGVTVSAIYRTQDVSGMDDQGLAKCALGDLDLAQQSLGRSPFTATKPAVSTLRVLRWSEVIPRYAPGHCAELLSCEAQLAQELPGLHLAGSYSGGVSVEDCVTRGLAIGKRAHAALPTIDRPSEQKNVQPTAGDAPSSPVLSEKPR